MTAAPPYRQGFESQPEEVSRRRLAVDGDLPAWLDGRYLANGPGEFEVGGEPLCHWFDSLAMLRGFDVGDGEVTYTNRYVRSEDFAFAREHGRVRTAFPGTPPDRPLPVRLWQALSGTVLDNPVIGVMHDGDGYLAITESAHGIRFDPDSLETVGRVDRTDGVDADLVLAHLHETDGAVFNLGVSYGRRTSYTLYRQPKGGQPRSLTRLTFEKPPYVHSFALAGDLAVVPDPPVGVDPTALLTGAFTGGTFLDAVRSYDRPGRFHVLDTTTGERVAAVEADPYFVYHHANAYRADGEVVVDCVAYPDERAITALTLENLRSDRPELPGGDLVRYRLPLSGGRARRETLREGPMEFPSIAYRRRNGRRHRYVYAAETRGGSSLPTQLAKIDTRGGATTWAQQGSFPGEPVFVPAPDPDTEDDGVVLSVVLDADAGRSFLLVLDATDLGERARAPLPHRLPYGFHGQFYRRDDPTRGIA
jgi:carotenoid cleavage dioxygenase-like enzyme